MKNRCTTRRVSRAAFTAVAAITFAGPFASKAIAQPYYVNAGHLKLRLVQLADERHVSDYDLVQVFALPADGGSFTGDEATVLPAMQTDMTFDGQSSSEDIAAYASYFAEGAPIADHDESGAVDGDDLVGFLQDWAEAQS